MTDSNVQERARKERSPSFPFIPLEKAIERAKAVAEAHKRSPARLAVVGETWGYAPKSSGLLQTVAALKSYGLTDDVGRGEDRRIQLTDLASRILFDTREGAREAAIVEAALRPRLIAEYAQQWLPERPSDNHCVSELHLDRGFSPEAARLFLRVFDETAAFANLAHSDKVSVSLQEGEPFLPVSESTLPVPVGYGAKPGSVPMPSRPQAATRPLSFYGGEMLSSAPRAVLPLPEGQVALEIPSFLSRKSFNALKAWIDVMMLNTETTVRDYWYVEFYTPTSTRAEAAHRLGTWDDVKTFIELSKQGYPGAIVRVIAPDSASREDLAELRTMGVRTF